MTVAMWIVALLAGALVLAAAKAHGRQVRLEREAAGFPVADFRAPPPPVAAIWRRDRVRFWMAYPPAAAALGAALLAAGRGPGAAAAGAAAGGAALAFAYCGARSARELARAHPAAARAGRAGSWAWWGLAGALGAALAALL